MKKRLRKKMWKLGRIEHGVFFMDLEKEIREKGIVMYPLGKYYFHDGKLYKFKV